MKDHAPQLFYNKLSIVTVSSKKVKYINMVVWCSSKMYLQHDVKFNRVDEHNQTGMWLYLKRKTDQCRIVATVGTGTNQFIDNNTVTELRFYIPHNTKCHFGAVLPSQSFGLVTVLTQQKQTQIHNKIYYDKKIK